MLHALRDRPVSLRPPCHHFIMRASKIAPYNLGATFRGVQACQDRVAADAVHGA